MDFAIDEDALKQWRIKTARDESVKFHSGNRFKIFISLALITIFS